MFSITENMLSYVASQKGSSCNYDPKYSTRPGNINFSVPLKQACCFQSMVPIFVSGCLENHI